mmetsp:Transcript_21976/g.33558  ORF Transcript_21976/g.33558 Transcript_21976/m.33558 type:complete len:90 (-) Transcript_21976:1402-1671(-)
MARALNVARVPAVVAVSVVFFVCATLHIYMNYLLVLHSRNAVEKEEAFVANYMYYDKLTISLLNQRKHMVVRDPMQMDHSTPSPSTTGK